MRLAHPMSSEDRNFFSLVADAIYSNPFLEQRTQILKKIDPGIQIDPESHEFRIREIGNALNQRIENLEGKGLKTVQHGQEADRAMMRHAFLLQAYLRFESELNGLIQEQLGKGTESVKVRFASEWISNLKNRGFSINESVRYFELVYQIHRAFFFITRDLLGDCASMKQLRVALWNNIFTFDIRTYDQHLWNRMEDFSTLLLGETGTGKGAAAIAIGRSGLIPFDTKTNKFRSSFMETFSDINLSQFPESLIESELFGHKKGSFTGAIGDFKGVFECCSPHGALFLDEIGEVSVPVQIKLLKVLQDRVFTPVGSYVPKRFEGRVIAATNHSLEDLLDKGQFREDFFYRLCSDLITVPPLRQRIKENPEELNLLVELLVQRITGEKKSNLAGTVLETLSRDLPPNYSWPGNVRELEQAIRRIILNRSYSGKLWEPKTGIEDQLIEGIKAGTLNADDLLGYYCALLFQRFGKFEDVAKHTDLNWRTAKKYIQSKI